MRCLWQSARVWYHVISVRDTDEPSTKTIMQKRRHPALDEDDDDDNDQEFWEQIWSEQTVPNDSMGERVLATTTAATDSDANIVWSTAYVTVYVPTSTRYISVANTSSSLSPSRSSSEVALSTPSETARFSSTPILLSPGIYSGPAKSTSKSPRVVPGSLATSSSDSGPSKSSATLSLPTDNALLNATSSSNATMGSIAESMPSGQKRAIVGGLSGTIAGLVLIGLLIFLVLRRRRKQQEARDFDEDSVSEKGAYSSDVVQKWGGIATATPIGRGSPRDSQHRPSSATQIAVDEEHRIIRMSTRHWPRPYAMGEGEGYRESVPTGQLRVVNPDVMRPATPRRPSTETVASYLRRQQSALAAFSFGLPKSARHSRIEQLTRAGQTPSTTIALVDPSLSRECVVGTPSFKSFVSLGSLPTIRQHPPEDPFLTPLPECDCDALPPLPPPSARGTQRRPSATPLQQNPANSTSRTLSQRGYNLLLQPFRPKSSNVPTAQQKQKQTYISSPTDSCPPSSCSSSPSYIRMSGRSDPFDLDHPSVRGSHTTTTMTGAGAGGGGGISLYEGT